MALRVVLRVLEGNHKNGGSEYLSKSKLVEDGEDLTAAKSEV